MVGYRDSLVWPDSDVADWITRHVSREVVKEINEAYTRDYGEYKADFDLLDVVLSHAYRELSDGKVEGLALEKGLEKFIEEFTETAESMTPRAIKARHDEYEREMKLLHGLDYD